MKFSPIVPLTALALTFGQVSVAQDLTPEEVKRLALEAIMENPQIVMDAVELLRAQEDVAKQNAQAQGFEDNKELLMTDANAPVLGNPDGDVTVVEFFDYNCGYCKRAGPAIQALIEQDPMVKVVYREFPILSEGSMVAARASLAARKQDKYVDFHWALMGSSSLDFNSVMQLASDMGFDMDKLEADMAAPEVDEHIQTSRDLASALQFTGTPSFVIGDTIVPGYIPVESMKELIAQTRANNG